MMQPKNVFSTVFLHCMLTTQQGDVWTYVQMYLSCSDTIQLENVLRIVLTHRLPIQTLTYVFPTVLSASTLINPPSNV